MKKLLLAIPLMLNLLLSTGHSQTCEITEVTALALPCNGNFFSVSIDLEVVNPASPGFTLAGNGVIYGTFLYSDLPVTVGPMLGDDESAYEFIAWDVENADCQQFTTIPASNCGPICSISNFNLEFVSCVGSQSAIVVFDFDYENPSGVTFDLFNEEGDNIGTWLYTSLPVTEPFFVVSGAEPIVLTVCDHNDPDCCETFTLDAIDCTPNNCEFYSVTVDPVCTGSNFVVHLDFGIDNPASDSFTVVGNTLNYGTFGYNELPITLGPLNGSTGIMWEFNIADSELPACTETALLGIYNCPPPCDILAMEAMALECNGNDAYSLEIGLDIEGEGDLGFAVFSETFYYGTYSYANLPILIPAFQSTCEPDDIVSVCDTENPGCCATVPFEALQCCGCLIYNLSAIALPCNAEDQIFIEIDFDYQNVSTEGFEISGNMTNYGEFSYDDLPVQVGPFLGDGSVDFQFVVADLVDPFCFDAVELGFIDCSEICELSNLSVETGDCTGNNQYVAVIDFAYQGTTGVGFDLIINGEPYEFYSYDDLPLTLQEFPSSGTGMDTVTVCENDNENCCATLIFAAPNCACSLFDATAEILDCTSDSTFAISLEFFYENLPGNSVDVFLDGVFLSFFNVADIPFVIEIPEGDGTALLTICANDLNTCCDEVLIELMTCESPPCHIVDLVADPGICTSDTTYNLFVHYFAENLPSDSVLVTSTQGYSETFVHNPDGFTIANFPAYTTGNTTITVCAIGAPDCCDVIEFTTPDCGQGFECNISDLGVDVGGCTSDSTYLLHVIFQSQGLPGDSVVLTGNGNPIGQYPAAGGLIIIQDFPVYETNHTTISVCAVGAPDCCDVVEFETQNCEGPCQIGELVADPVICTSDSTYNLFIHYFADNLPSDSVVVTTNQGYEGHFLHNPDGFTIENFPAYTSNNTAITVCALGAPDCCDVVEFETLDCGQGLPCHIFDLVAEIGDCTSDTTYILHISFQSDNLPGDSVALLVNGNLFGVYPAEPGSITIEHFPSFEENHTVITICAIGAPDCCDVYEFETQNCEGGGTCHIDDLVADPGECHPDTTYSLFINYHAINLGTDSVVVTTPEGYSGIFTDHPDGFTIDSFPAYHTQFTVIELCAFGDTTCCDVFQFETPDCGQGFICEIYNLLAETGECTSDTTYVLDVVFDGNSLPSDSVDIYTDSVLVGRFLIDPEYIHIENFPHQPGEQTTVTVCAAGSTDCCESYTFETPFCTSECVIYDISVNVFDCNSDTTFGVVLHFEHQNIDAGGFDVYAGDTYLGFYPIDQVPIEIGHFPSNETGQYQVTICESDNLECCTTYAFDGPPCGTGVGCEITNLTYTLTECDEEGNFYFILDFDFEDIGNEGFNVVGNGNNYGTFSYDSVPVQIGPFPTDDTFYEFEVSDNSHPDCSASILPGIVNCFVSTSPVDYELFFQVFNNGTIPGIQAKQDINVSVYHANGKTILDHFPVTADDYYELNNQPAGLYIAIVSHGDYFWPIKLVKAGF